MNLSRLLYEQYLFNFLPDTNLSFAKWLSQVLMMVVHGVILKLVTFRFAEAEQFREL